MAPLTQINTIQITQMQPQLVISVELSAANVITVSGLLPASLRRACGGHVRGSPSPLCSPHLQ